MKAYYRQSGLTLVELMIAMLLGLVVLGAVYTVFLGNTNTYRTNEAVARIQESARFAFELMARDLREAGGLPCGDDLDVANVLNNVDNNDGNPNTGDDWWAAFNGGLEGLDQTDALSASSFGTSAGDRVNGTDAIVISGASGGNLSVQEHQVTSAQFKVNETNHGIAPGDLLVVCDFEQASIFQATNANQSNRTVMHNTGTGTPGNCSKGLGLPVQCTSNGTPKEYGPNSVLARFRSSAWYLGCNGRADCGIPEGRSLFRSVNGTGNEVVDLVDDLQIEYLEDGETSYTAAGSVADWGDVLAIRISLVVGRTQDTGTDPVRRTFSHTVALRNRLP